jgi:hypothetical protein
MDWKALVPASLLALLATAALALVQLVPMGQATVLVRLTSAEPLAALTAAALSDAVLLEIPLAGFAVLRGDAARIRAVAGLAVAWRRNAPCSSST